MPDRLIFIKFSMKWYYYHPYGKNACSCNTEMKEQPGARVASGNWETWPITSSPSTNLVSRLENLRNPDLHPTLHPVIFFMMLAL